MPLKTTTSPGDTVPEPLYCMTCMNAGAVHVEAVEAVRRIEAVVVVRARGAPGDAASLRSAPICRELESAYPVEAITGGTAAGRRDWRRCRPRPRRRAAALSLDIAGLAAHALVLSALA